MNRGPVKDLVPNKVEGIVKYNTWSHLWPLSAPTHVCNCTHTGMNIEKKNRKEELEGVFVTGIHWTTPLFTSSSNLTSHPFLLNRAI